MISSTRVYNPQIFSVLEALKDKKLELLPLIVKEQ